MSAPPPDRTNADRRPLPDIRRQPLLVVLENIRSAHNVGSILRTCDGAAVAEVMLVGITAHPPSPKLAKTALGAEGSLLWSHYRRMEDALASLAAREISVVSVERCPGSVRYNEVAFPQPVALVFGNEVEGVSARAREASACIARIPMLGLKESLNVTTACGIVLYEALRQWHGFWSTGLYRKDSTYGATKIIQQGRGPDQGHGGLH